MKKLNLTIFAAFISLLISSSAFASVAGNPESEASSIAIGFFNIKYINEASLLTWTTASNVSGAAFTIERSEDGKSYNEIGKVKVVNSNSFNFIDYSPVLGINYYRFKRVDSDGKLTISPVRVVITEKNSPFSTFPTHVKTSLTITSTYTSKNATAIKVISLKTGEVVYEATLASDKTEIQLDLSTLTAGNYVTKMEVDGKTYNSTFVKQ